MSQSTKVMTPQATLSYPHLVTPQAADNGQGKPKYSCALVFPAGADLAALRAAALEAARAKWGAVIKAGNQSIPIEKAFDLRLLRSPFRDDAVAKGYPEGSIFLNVRTEQQPGCVFGYAGTDGKPARMTIEQVKAEMYAGARVRATVAAFAYEQQGNKGVSFALNNLQKLAEGDRLDGRVAAENEFDAPLNEAPASLEDMIG